jgi:hypothetical protein
MSVASEIFFSCYFNGWTRGNHLLNFAPGIMLPTGMRVEKENGVERLILSAWRYVMPTSQIRQELLELLVTERRDCASVSFWSPLARRR